MASKLSAWCLNTWKLKIWVFVSHWGEKHLYFNTHSDNKEQKGGTIGQTKSLHGKPFPTASQLQGYSRFKEGWRHPLLGLIGKMENVDKRAILLKCLKRSCSAVILIICFNIFHFCQRISIIYYLLDRFFQYFFFLNFSEFCLVLFNIFHFCQRISGTIISRTVLFVPTFLISPSLTKSPLQTEKKEIIVILDSSTFWGKNSPLH